MTQVRTILRADCSTHINERQAGIESGILELMNKYGLRAKRDPQDLMNRGCGDLGTMVEVFEGEEMSVVHTEILQIVNSRPYHLTHLVVYLGPKSQMDPLSRDVHGLFGEYGYTCSTIDRR